MFRKAKVATTRYHAQEGKETAPRSVKREIQGPGHGNAWNALERSLDAAIGPAIARNRSLNRWHSAARSTTSSASWTFTGSDVHAKTLSAGVRAKRGFKLACLSPAGPQCRMALLVPAGPAHACGLQIPRSWRMRRPAVPAAPTPGPRTNPQVRRVRVPVSMPWRVSVDPRRARSRPRSRGNAFLTGAVVRGAARLQPGEQSLEIVAAFRQLRLRVQ